MGRMNFDFSDMVPEYLKESPQDGNAGAPAVEDIPRERLVPFCGHPFSVNADSEEMEQLVESIRDRGILVPLLARTTRDPDRYELVSGHRRLYAAGKAGLDAVPVIIRDMDDAQAVSAMVYSNQYRENIPVSEKARACRMCCEAERRAGRNREEDAVQAAQERSGSRRTFFRLVRISHLTDGLLKRVDAKEISLGAAYELAFLETETQETVEAVLAEYGFKISEAQAQKLRSLAGEGPLLRETVTGVLAAAGEKKQTKITFRRKDIAGYFPEGTDTEEMQRLILSLLDEYAGKHRE